MPIVYCNDDGDNTTGASWATAYTTLGTAVTNANAGDDIYIGMDHAESPAGATYTFPDARGNPVRVISANTSTSAYDNANNVQIDVSAAAYDLNISGCVNFYGVHFKIGDDFFISTGVDDNPIEFHDSILEMDRSTGAKIYCFLANGNVSLTLVESEVRWNNADSGSQFIFQGGGKFEMRGGSCTMPAGTHPIGLVDFNAPSNVDIRFHGVNLDDFDDTLVDAGTIEGSRVLFTNCRLNSAVSLVSNTFSDPTANVTMIGCDDTTDNGDVYRYEKETYYGTITANDTVYRTGGASDGTQQISWQMDAATAATAVEYSEPLVSDEIVLWNTSTSSTTFTINVVWDSASDLQTDEIWMELEYLNAAGNTQTAFSNDRMADILATPADHDNNTETWTGTGGFANENKITLSVTVTPGRAGPAKARVYLAKQATVYVDPLIVAS